MNTKEVENKIIENFKNSKFFTREELLNFFRKSEPDISNSTLGWRIYELRKKGLIRDIKRGVYIINQKSVFEPLIDKKIQEIYSIISKLFKNNYTKKELSRKLCIWDTKWLNEFMIHQIFTSFIVLESNKEALSSIYFELKNNGIKEVFIEPDENLLIHNVVTENEPVILKRITTKPPIIQKENVTIPALEKILVDLFCEKELYYAFQGSELKNIFRNSINKYEVNIGKLINYSRRRRRENEIKNFLTENITEELRGIKL